MRRWVMCAALLGGCYQPAAEATCSVRCSTGVCPSGMTCGGDGLCRINATDNCNAINDAGNDDAGDDASGLCFGNGFIQNFCILPTDAPRTFGTTTLSTSGTGNACDLTLSQSEGTTLCFIIGKTVSITGAVRVTGLNPIVFLGTDSVTIGSAGSIDVASHAPQAANYGAGGAGAVGCTAVASLRGSDDQMASGGGGGGGAGGSFTGFGGNGGAGLATTGGARGAVITPLTSVRGGCAAGYGGNGTPGAGGRGGYGGGAVYLLTGGPLVIQGKINASGAGGNAPTPTGGGGGGGSGGFIGLDAASYAFSNALMIAIGGAGASGGTASVGGVQGYEASTTTAPGPTPGGTGAGLGGVGGSFAAGGDGGAGSVNAGGGGGGGAGFIGIAGFSGQAPPGAMYAPMPQGMLR